MCMISKLAILSVPKGMWSAGDVVIAWPADGTCVIPRGIGVNRDGAFAEFISVPVTNIWYCDKSIPLDVISCFDPLGNAGHTALTFNLVGEDVLITGAGPIGCMAAGVARQVGRVMWS